MAEEKRSPLDRLLFATFLKGRTSSRDLWDEKGEVTAEDAEYSKLLTKKKAAYPDYRKSKDEIQELLRAQRNVELFFAEEKTPTEKTQFR